MKNLLFPYAKTKAQISFTVTAQLISTFVFATQIEQSLYFLNPKFHASSLLLRQYSLVLCLTWLATLKTGFLARLYHPRSGMKVWREIIYSMGKNIRIYHEFFG